MYALMCFDIFDIPDSRTFWFWRIADTTRSIPNWQRDCRSATTIITAPVAPSLEVALGCLRGEQWVFLHSSLCLSKPGHGLSFLHVWSSPAMAIVSSMKYLTTQRLTARDRVDAQSRKSHAL